MILKPSQISPNGTALDNASQFTISWVNKGDRSTAYQIKFYKLSDNSLIYDTTKITTLNSFHVVPINTLTAGTEYKYNIQVWNSLNETATSEWATVKASSTPLGTFTNLSGTIGNANYTFSGSYSQAQGVGLKTWQMILYNVYDEIIGDSGLIYSETIEHEFSGLDNGNTYKIELQVRSQDNLLATTGKLSFQVSFDVPKTAVALTANKIEALAGVELLWSVTQILGKSDSSTYINNEALDVRNGKKVYFDEGFTIQNNFTLELWLESVTNYTFNINSNMAVKSYQTAPADTTVFWIDNSSQTTELPLTVVRGSQVPTDPNVLWIEDINQPINTTLTVIADVYTPVTTNNLWIDLSDGVNINLDIVKMKNNSNEEISIRYFNGKFHLYKNDELIDSVTVSSTKYYLYIQQIGEDLVLHAEAIV